MRMIKDGKIVDVPNNLVPAHIEKGWKEYKEEIKISKPLTNKGFESKKPNLNDNEEE